MRSKIKDLISNSKSILLLTHESPDGDAIGSVLAIYRYLTSINKNVDMVILDVPKVFEFLPFPSMVYTPVMIYLGKYTGMELIFELSKQIIWVVILYAVGSLIWKQVTKRLVVLGG